MWPVTHSLGGTLKASACSDAGCGTGYGSANSRSLPLM